MERTLDQAGLRPHGRRCRRRIPNIVLATAVAVLGHVSSALPAAADVGTFNQYLVPSFPGFQRFAGIVGLARGSDGNMWFTEQGFGQVGRVTPAGVITEFPLPGGRENRPTEMTAGPDGALWFTLNNDPGAIGRITTDGVFTQYPVPTPFSRPWAITTGRDGAIWFSEDANKIGRLDPATGAMKEFAIPTPQAEVSGMAVGPDGEIWFTELGGNKIGRITKGGAIREFSVPGSPWGITTGPDGNLWFALNGSNQIGRMNTKGKALTRFPIPTANSNVIGITAGGDGNLWFSEGIGKKVGRITPQGTITEFAVPNPGSGTFGGGPIALAPGHDPSLLWFTEGAGRVSNVTVS